MENNDVAGKTDKRVEEFREFCRDNKKYGMSSLGDVIAAYGSFELATRKPEVLDEPSLDEPIDLGLDL